ncbi:hypothetical protein [Sorangium sp. So ce385]|uniref:hypothetical protein n=1 Tax=Sorangium sp. So ce385 TaxID=3133308 RepID=UPI003F5B4688
MSGESDVLGTTVDADIEGPRFVVKPTESGTAAWVITPEPSGTMYGLAPNRAGGVYAAGRCDDLVTWRRPHLDRAPPASFADVRASSRFLERARRPEAAAQAQAAVARRAALAQRSTAGALAGAPSPPWRSRRPSPARQHENAFDGCCAPLDDV